LLFNNREKLNACSAGREDVFDISVHGKKWQFWPIRSGIGCPGRLQDLTLRTWHSFWRGMIQTAQAAAVIMPKPVSDRTRVVSRPAMGSTSN